MFTKIAVEKIEKGAMIITSGEYKASNWTNPKLHGLEIIAEPKFMDGNKRALVTYRDESGKEIDGCIKVVDDNGWDVIILVTPYDYYQEYRRRRPDYRRHAQKTEHQHTGRIQKAQGCSCFKRHFWRNDYQI